MDFGKKIGFTLQTIVPSEYYGSFRFIFKNKLYTYNSDVSFVKFTYLFVLNKKKCSMVTAFKNYYCVLSYVSYRLKLKYSSDRVKIPFD